MSVFSRIKMSKKAAKEAKGKAVEADKEPEPVKLPYRHVPTHAAVDALSGAPSSWKQDDLYKIKDAHKRRSQMISRTGSSLSNMASGSSTPAAAPQFSRHASYHSAYQGTPHSHPVWFDNSNHAAYSETHLGEPVHKRQKPSRAQSYYDSNGIGPSPLGSNINSNLNSEQVSPVVSSGNSTSSDSSDHLEIAATGKGKAPVRDKPQPSTFAERDIFDRLQNTTGRKLGEAPVLDGPPPQVARPTPIVNAMAAEQKQKKQRWSFMGKKTPATVVV